MYANVVRNQQKIPEEISYLIKSYIHLRFTPAHTLPVTTIPQQQHSPEIIHMCNIGGNAVHMLS